MGAAGSAPRLMTTPLSNVAQNTVAAAASTSVWRWTSAERRPPSWNSARNAVSTVPAAKSPTSAGLSSRATTTVCTSADALAEGLRHRRGRGNPLDPASEHGDGSADSRPRMAAHP